MNRCCLTVGRLYVLCCGRLVRCFAPIPSGEPGPALRLGESGFGWERRVTTGREREQGGQRYQWDGKQHIKIPCSR